MKKKSLILAAVLSIILFAHAAVYHSYNFISPANSTTPLKNVGYVALVLTNGGTGFPSGETGTQHYTNGMTNVLQYVYGNNYPSIVNISTPIVAYSTNMVGNVSGGTIGANGFTNITALAGTLQYVNPLGYSLTGTNTFYIAYTNGVTNSTGGNLTANFGAPLFSPLIPLSSDANGNTLTNLVITLGMVCDGTATNTNTFRFMASADGLTFSTSSLQTLVLTQTGTTPVVTNWTPPTWWLNGMRYITMYDYYSGTNGSTSTSTNTYLYVATLNTWAP